jgi:hypothetical protein
VDSPEARAAVLDDPMKIDDTASDRSLQHIGLGLTELRRENFATHSIRC